MNKRGDVTTIVILIFLMLGLSFGAIIFNTVFQEFTDELKQVDEFSNRSVDTIETTQESAPKLLDFFVFFTLISFFIGLIIASIYIDVNPAVIMVFVIVLVIAVILAGQVSNAFEQFSAQDELTSSVASFPLTSLILGSYFPVIILVIGMVVIIILYGKSRRQGLGGEV
jgi:hypothetical protein